MADRVQIKTIANKCRKPWQVVLKVAKEAGMDIPKDHYLTWLPADAGDWIEAKLGGKNPPPYKPKKEEDKHELIVNKVVEKDPEEEKRKAEEAARAKEEAEREARLDAKRKRKAAEKPRKSLSQIPLDADAEAQEAAEAEAAKAAEEQQQEAAKEVAPAVATPAAAEEQPPAETTKEPEGEPAQEVAQATEAAPVEAEAKAEGVKEARVLSSVDEAVEENLPKIKVIDHIPVPVGGFKPKKTRHTLDGKTVAERKESDDKDQKDDDKSGKGKKKKGRELDADDPAPKKVAARGKVQAKKRAEKKLRIPLEEETPDVPMRGSTIVDVSNTVLNRPPKASSRPSGPVGTRRKARKSKQKQSQAQQAQEPLVEKQEIVAVSESMLVRDVAKLFGVPVTSLVAEFIKQGKMYSVNQVVSPQEIFEVGEALEIMVEYEEGEKKYEKISKSEGNQEGFVSRAPVVTVMGHVDHGKTSLLDAVRNARVIETESGGITQHIGAYKVSINNQDIVFLDTPGHEAFSAMRARGAHVTDIVILVVAADDGVKPQTKEAISHARSAGVPIIVAINKIDKEGANPMLVKTELMNEGLVAEDYGGDIITCEISAKQHMGIDNLLEMVLLQSEVLELKARKEGLAEGTIVEAQLDKQRGPIATVLVQSGTLRLGDAFVAGAEYGRVRAMVNDRGEKLTEAGPSTPVEILGFNGVPVAGEIFKAEVDDRKARMISENRKSSEVRSSRAMGHAKLGEFYDKLKKGEVHELALIVKADVQGSVEAVTDSLLKLSSPKVTIKILHAAPGNITESDVSLAAASHAIIVGFHVGQEGKARNLAQAEGVDVRLYEIIYNLTEDVQNAMLGLLPPDRIEEEIGVVEVRQIFKLSRAGIIAGSYVESGKVTRSAFARIVRDGELVYDGKINSLKRFKEDVKEVAAGFECGVGLDGYTDYKEGDKIICYEFQNVAAKLN